MLTITIPETELYDEKTNTFFTTQKKTIKLEHSLISASLWEAKWKRCFTSKPPSTAEETIDYIKCMCLDKNIDDLVFRAIPMEEYQKVLDYIADPMTATKITDRSNSRGNSEQLTTEVIYFYMTAFNIPFSCEKWHLNRLLTLIKVCSIKNGGDQKMGKHDIMNQNKALNAARRAKMHSKG